MSEERDEYGRLIEDGDGPMVSELDEQYQGQATLYVGMCVDCGTTQPDQKMMDSPFVQAGMRTTCRYCGGPVAIVPEGSTEQLMDKRRRTGGML